MVSVHFLRSFVDTSTGIERQYSISRTCLIAMYLYAQTRLPENSFTIRLNLFILQMLS